MVDIEQLTKTMNNRTLEIQDSFYGEKRIVSMIEAFKIVSDGKLVISKGKALRTGDILDLLGVFSKENKYALRIKYSMVLLMGLEKPGLSMCSLVFRHVFDEEYIICP